MEEAVNEERETLGADKMYLIRNQQAELPKCLWCCMARGQAEVEAIFLQQDILPAF